MLPKVRLYLGVLGQPLFHLAAILALLLVVAGLWWWLPLAPRIAWKTAHESTPAIYISQNGQALTTVDESSLTLWDTDTGRQRVRLLELLDPESSLPPHLRRGKRYVWLAPDGQTVLFRGEGRQIMLWHAERHPQPVPVLLPVDAYGLAIATDSSTAIAFSEDGPKCWDLIRGQERPFASSLGRWSSSTFNSVSPVVDGAPILAVQLRDDQSVLVWDLFAQTKTALPIASPIRVAFAGNGQVLAAWHDATENTIEARIWDLTTGQQRCVVPISHRSTVHALNAQGTRLIVDVQLSSGWACELWDVSQTQARRIGEFDPGSHYAFSPDGHWLYVQLTKPSDVFIWETNTLRQPISLGQYAGKFEFSPDSRFLAGWCRDASPRRLSWLQELLGRKTNTASVDMLKLWEVATGKEAADFADAAAFAFFPDGKRLATWRENTVENTVEIWDLPPRRPWWIEYGLPVLFVLLLLLACWQCIRFRRRLVRQ
jgi:WD40 repeat protein